MNQVAFILENTTIYWHSIVMALSVLAGICFFMACCNHLRISGVHAAATVLTGLALSLLISRLMYWYSRADSFKSFGQALTTPASGSYSLTGVFIGCAITALIMGIRSGKLAKLLDCMSVAGCSALCLGRLSNFFTTADRGQIVTEMTFLPWAYPVMNAASGMPDYRLATFVFQSIIAGILFLVLGVLFFSDRKKTRIPHGDITLLFLMVYSASQILLDSTRYDSLYFRSNGFVSIVQVLCAVVLGVSIILVSVRAVKARGLQRWMIGAWAILVALFGLAGYMEYYVQRHGKLAFFSYTVMEHCLIGILVVAICLWRQTLPKKGKGTADSKAEKKKSKKRSKTSAKKADKESAPVDTAMIPESASETQPEVIAEPVAEPPTEEIPETATVETPEAVEEVPSAEGPTETAEIAPEAVSEEIPKDVSETVFEEVSQKVPPEATDDTEETKKEAAEQVTEESDPEEKSRIISDHFFEDLFSDLPSGFLDDVSDDFSNLLS